MATFTIRIPDSLRDEIRAAADEDKRSVNGEIEWLLREALSLREIATAANVPHPERRQS